MPQSQPVDDFRLTYERSGAGAPVILLHGWPGDRTDYRLVAPLLATSCDVVVPDLRGFGESDKHPVEPSEQYDATGQARSIVGLIGELGLTRPVLAGYDVGSRVAQAVARDHPDLIGGLVLAPPLPGAGDRVLTPDAQREFWYQTLHRLPLVEQLVDGNPQAVRAYLGHFWSHWSGPSYAVDDEALDHLVGVYGAPGSFTASIAWYRAGAGSVVTYLSEQRPAAEDRIPTPTSVLWPEHDPLFPRAWSDRLDDFFSDVELRFVDGVGHFTPLECADVFADAVAAATGRK